MNVKTTSPGAGSAEFTTNSLKLLYAVAGRPSWMCTETWKASIHFHISRGPFCEKSGWIQTGTATTVIWTRTGRKKIKQSNRSDKNSFYTNAFLYCSLRGLIVIRQIFYSIRTRRFGTLHVYIIMLRHSCSSSTNLVAFLTLQNPLGIIVCVIIFYSINIFML